MIKASFFTTKKIIWITLALGLTVAIWFGLKALLGPLWASILLFSLIASAEMLRVSLWSKQIKDILLFPDLNQALALLAAYFVMQFVLMTTLPMLFRGEWITSAFSNLVASILATSALALAFYLRFKKQAQIFLGFKSTNWKMLAYALILSVVLSAMLIMMDILMSRIANVPYVSMLPTVGVSSVVYLLIWIPITHEILFRSVILRGLSAHFSVTVAILISALMASFAHANPVYFPYVFLSSVAAAILFVRSQSIWPGALLKFMTTLIPFVVLRFI